MNSIKSLRYILGGMLLVLAAGTLHWWLSNPETSAGTVSIVEPEAPVIVAPQRPGVRVQSAAIFLLDAGVNPEAIQSHPLVPVAPVALVVDEVTGAFLLQNLSGPPQLAPFHQQVALGGAALNQR